MFLPYLKPGKILQAIEIKVKLSYNSAVKKKLLSLLAIFALSSIFLSKIPSASFSAFAQTSQPQGMCYSQCGVYKFFWRGDFCFDLLRIDCNDSLDATDVVLMLKNIRKGFLTGKLTQVASVEPILRAWLICKPLVEDCIAPQLDDCETVCKENSLKYAPNLTVGGEFGSFHGLFYNEKTSTLHMRVMNIGAGYTSDIGVKLTSGETGSRDTSSISQNPVFSDTIPELLFVGSRQATPKDVTDTTIDFLIDESNFSKYLQKFKSDADFKYIPPAWEKSLRIETPDGKLTRFILEVDPGQEIAETNENDNIYTLDVDKRPTPARFEFGEIRVFRLGNSLEKYRAEITVKNTGESEGNALVSFYEGGKLESSPVHTQTRTIDGKSTGIFQVDLTVDASQGFAGCAVSRTFGVTLKDSEGFSSQTQFSVPIFAGEIFGKVTDKNDKYIEGATVKASTGQVVLTDKYGNYHIRGIKDLGEVTLTFSHPDYTSEVTKKVDIAFEEDPNIQGFCKVSGLAHYGVNAILKDKTLRLKIRLISAQGNSLDGKVALLGGKESFVYEIPGEKTIEEMEPGQYRVTASSLGYVTKEVQIVITPDEYTLEIKLEPLFGRESDQGLTLMTPVKLWEKKIGEGSVGVLTGSKNGKLLVVSTNQNSSPSQRIGKLNFINPQNGALINTVEVPFNSGQSQQVSIDSSYDGSTIAFLAPNSLSRTKSKAKGTNASTVPKTFFKIYNAQGAELGDLSEGRRNPPVIVSPDGFYLYPPLTNSNLHVYTKEEILGLPDDPGLPDYVSGDGFLFLRDNNLVGPCKGDKGICVSNFLMEPIRKVGIPNSSIGPVAADASYDGNSIAVRNPEELAFFGKSSWSKELENDAKFLSVAVTPGGDYVIVAMETEKAVDSLLVFDALGKDVTPKFDYKHVRLVEANDRGMFFLKVVGNVLTYYQLGKYESDYIPPDIPDSTDSSENMEERGLIKDLQVYNPTENRFEDADGNLTWEDLLPEYMYRIPYDSSVYASWGKLNFSKNSIFSRSSSGEILLIWGQVEIEANSPISLVAFKNKLPDLEKLYSSFNQYNQGILPKDKFVILRNLHTKFKVKSDKEEILVWVEQGSVEASYKGAKVEVNSGSKLTIDEAGDVSKSTDWGALFLRIAASVLTIFVFAFFAKIVLKKLNISLPGGLHNGNPQGKNNSQGGDK